MRSVRRVGMTLVVLAMWVTCSARAQVLTMMPDNALVVIKIKNLQDVSGKVAVLSQQWGLANIRPELNDPLGTLLTVANLGPGLNKAGEAAAAVMQPSPGSPIPNMLFLVPVTDFKAFAAALPNSKPDGELTMFSPGGGQPGYVADWGKYAAMSPQRENVTKKPAGLQVSAMASKEMDVKDLIVYANIKELRKQALPAIQQNKAQILQMMEAQMRNAPGANPKFAPLMKAYMGQFITVIEGFLRDADGATFGVNLSKDGISTTLLADFQPESYSGKAVRALKNTDASLTAGLPDSKYFFYGGVGGGDPTASLQLFTDFVAPIQQEAAALGEEAKSINDYIAGMKTFITSSKSMTFGLVAPPANMIGQEGLLQMVTLVKGDAAKLVAAQNQVMTAEKDLMKLSGMENIVKFSKTPDAKTVDGVSLTEYRMAMEGQPQTPQEQQMAFVMQFMYGPKGVSVFTGPIGADKVVTVVGGNETLLTSAIAAAKTDSDPLSKGIGAKVAAALPQSRLAVFYLPVDVIATTVLDVMAARGMPGGVKLPPNLPPLGAAIDTEGSAVRVDGYVPAQTVQSLIAAGMQMWLQGMNQGQPGGL